MDFITKQEFLEFFQMLQKQKNSVYKKEQLAKIETSSCL